ncbi:cytochrome c oxidase assembly protein [Caldalkalibacillus mannanilyticus]|uniref:cytochrome c oxidase assembly protein n=1 Tax=Caldalkalibacillus mannanilyticus TaxID=1418 RepID=UPI00068756C2|nr:cytochrome c oxidase assembly protein [Caldalkalibacillus mannanilyticus]
MHHNHHEMTAPMFSFFELWRPDIILLLVVIAIMYHFLTGAWRKHFADSEEITSKQKTLFFFSLLIIYLAKGTPLAAYGHHIMFSAHMAQMALLYLVLPPVLLLSIPAWIYKAILKPVMISKFVYFFTLPLVSILFFNMIFSLYHFPVVFDTVMQVSWLHFIYHSALIMGAIFMWWPICSPLPEYESLSDLKKIAYIFVSGFLLTPVCALIIFSRMPMYETYMGAPQIFSLLPSLDDQQLWNHYESYSRTLLHDCHWCCLLLLGEKRKTEGYSRYRLE